MSILFRQGPPRSLTYIAERLQKEGWFDDTGWEVDEGLLTNVWFPAEKMIVGANPRHSAKAIWEATYEAWNLHGRLHGLSLEQPDIDNRENAAKPFRAAFGVHSGQPVMDLREEQIEPPELRPSFKAHNELVYLSQNLQVTNFNHFKYQALAEKDQRMVDVRKLMFDAERLRRTANFEQAIRKFREAFERLCGNSALGKRGLLEEYPNFRSDSDVSDNLYEKHLVFLRLMEDHQGLAMRARMTAVQLFSFYALGGIGDNLGGAYAALLYQGTKRPRELPSLFFAPLDGKDSQDRPWVPEWTADQIKVREGYIKPQQQELPPGGPPPARGSRDIR